MEAGQLKKKKVEGKVKVKSKSGTPVSGVVESIAVDVFQDIQELKGLRMEVGDICAFAQHTVTVMELSWKTQQQTSTYVSEL